MSKFMPYLGGFVLALTVASCGGSSSAPGGTRNAGLQLKINWPTKSRLVPLTAKSIKLEVKSEGDVVGSKIVPRPTDGSNSSVVTLDGLPPVLATLTANTYPTETATGVAQSTGSAQIELVSNLQVQTQIIMDSTVTRLSLIPEVLNLQQGQSGTVTVSAQDKDGNIVLIANEQSSEPLTWKVADSAKASLSSNGSQATITALQTGESGIEVSMPVSDAGAVVRGSGAVVVSERTGPKFEILFTKRVNYPIFITNSSQFIVDSPEGVSYYDRQLVRHSLNWPGGSVIAVDIIENSKILAITQGTPFVYNLLSDSWAFIPNTNTHFPGAYLDASGSTFTALKQDSPQGPWYSPLVVASTSGVVNPFSLSAGEGFFGAQSRTNAQGRYIAYTFLKYGSSNQILASTIGVFDKSTGLSKFTSTTADLQDFLSVGEDGTIYGSTRQNLATGFGPNVGCIWVNGARTDLPEVEYVCGAIGGSLIVGGSQGGRLRIRLEDQTWHYIDEFMPEFADFQCDSVNVDPAGYLCGTRVPNGQPDVREVFKIKVTL